MGLNPIDGRVFFIQNVGKLCRIEDLATQLAFNKFDVLFAGDDAYLRMFA